MRNLQTSGTRRVAPGEWHQAKPLFPVLISSRRVLSKTLQLELGPYCMRGNSSWQGHRRKRWQS
jgi:hypothetical protein